VSSQSNFAARLSVTSLSLIIPALIQAQEGFSDSIQQIEIVGRSVNLVGSSVSASQGRVSHDELANKALLRTGDILESVPGLVATQHSGSGKANQYFLRGFNLDHGTDFATSIDGMPINMRSHGHGQGYTDLNFIIPEVVEEIIYRKGSYYADVGDFSGAGAAQMLTRNHVDEHALTLTGGELGYGRVLALGGLESLGGELFYGIESQTYEGPWDVIDEDVDKRNIWLKQSWERGSDEFSLSLMDYDNDWNSADQIPARAVDSRLITEFGSIDPTVGGSSSRRSVSANWARQGDASAWSASAYVIDYEMNLFSNFSYFTQPQGDQFQQIDDRRITGGELIWRGQTELAGLPLRNDAGLQLRNDDISAVGLRSTRQRQFQGDIRLDAVEELSSSVYWQSTLHATDKLRLMAGLRYDSFDFEVTALAAGDPSTLTANSGSADADLVTASFSAMYAVNDSNEFYFSIGEGFHSNDARGTTIQFDPVDGSAVQPVDPLVDTLGAEIGWRTFLTDRLNATVVLWQLDIDSELLFVGDAGNTEDTGVGSEREGLEVTAYYQATEDLALDFEYSWTDSRFEQLVDGSDEIPGALDKVMSAGINYQANDKLSANLRLRWFDDFPLDGGARAEGSSMVNFRLGYAINENFAIALDVLNLFDSRDHDVEYFYESQLPGESAPVEDRHYHVFEPRAARLNLEFKL
jgi:hypothetical protein